MRDQRPPDLAYRLLRRALAEDPAGPSILGDLHEDFVRMAERSGPARARAWYWKEALVLAVGRMARLGGAPNGNAGGRPGRGSRSRLGLRGILADTRAGLRSLRRNPGFVAFATLIIGVGIGASTAVFSVMRPLMLAPLPFESPRELVWVANNQEGTSLSHVTSRSSNLRDFRELSESFAGLTGFNAFFGQSIYTLVGDAEAEQLIGVDVAHDFLSVLGVRPLHGRDFTVAEGLWAGPPAVILGHGFWVRRFAGDPTIVGSAITLNGVPRDVVGVLPATFDFSSVFAPSVNVDFLLPFAVSDETDRTGNTWSMIGRLRPGATPASAQRDLDRIIDGLSAEDPDRWGLGAVVTPLQEQIAAPFRAGMLLLAAAAGTVMLIVCANLSNMLLARGPKRRREVAVRRALGATRGRLVRQLMIESLFLSVAGALVGYFIASSVTDVVANTSGLTIPLLRSVTVDAQALAFCAALALVTGVAIGVVPALQVSDGQEASAMSSGGSRSRGGRGSSRLRETLVVAEIALACVLLVFGGLFLRSFRAVLSVELGYDPENAVAWQLNPSVPFDNPNEMIAYFDQVADRVAAVSGVESAGLIDALPLGRNRTWGMRVVGMEEPPDGDYPDLFPHMIDTGYLETMGIPLLAGRAFNRDDARGSDPVVMINASAARELFGGADPIGHEISTGGSSNDWRIIGVVGDVRHQALEMGAGIQVYFPIRQIWGFNTLDLVVRSRVPVGSITGPVASVLRELDPGMPTQESWTLVSTVERASSSRKFVLTLLGTFAATALLLAALGIYGVLSYTVTERVPEIGIRMALGATSADVLRRVVGRTLLLATVGAAIGVVVSILGSGVIASLLFGVEPTDPLTFVGMIAMLLAVAAVSGLFPAIRASRTDSVTALKV